MTILIGVLSQNSKRLSGNVTYIVQDYEKALTSNLEEALKNDGEGYGSLLEKVKSTGILNSFKFKAEKMERVREILMRFGFLKDTYPYQPELSRHVVLVALLSCVFFSCFDIMQTLNDDNSIVWTVHVCLFAFFYFFLQPWIRFFSQPLIGKPSYSNLYKW